MTPRRARRPRSAIHRRAVEAVGRAYLRGRDRLADWPDRRNTLRAALDAAGKCRCRTCRSILPALQELADHAAERADPDA